MGITASTSLCYSVPVLSHPCCLSCSSLPRGIIPFPTTFLPFSFLPSPSRIIHVRTVRHTTNDMGYETQTAAVVVVAEAAGSGLLWSDEYTGFGLGFMDFLSCFVSLFSCFFTHLILIGIFLGGRFSHSILSLAAWRSVLLVFVSHISSFGTGRSYVYIFLSSLFPL